MCQNLPVFVCQRTRTTYVVQNTIVLDKWLKFKVSSNEEISKQNSTLILSLRELLDEVILERVVGMTSSPEERSNLVDRRKIIIEVVRKVLHSR